MNNEKICFNVGDEVYHKSNRKIEMVVVNVLEDINEISCRWTNFQGEIKTQVFLSQELVKIEKRDSMWYESLI